MASADLQWIEMTDFSPGIHSNNNLAGGLNVTVDNPCLAQPTDTYRCRSLPTGGLGPLPRRKENFVLTTPPTAEAGTVYRVGGLMSWGATFPDVLTDQDANHRAEIHMALDYYETVDDDRHLTWIRERIFDIAPSTETIINRDFLNVGTSGTARYAYFIKTRMRTSLPLELGQPVMCLLWANNPIGGSNDNRISRAHPDPTAPTTNATIVIGSEAEAYTIAVGHQGRILLGNFLSYDRGVDANLFTNENFLWTNVNLNTLSTATPAQFVPELDMNASDLAAMAANTVLVVKEIGGGYVIQGDLDDPTVVQLPNLMCPDGADYVHGANTPIGYVYSGGDDGLYVWNGGDASRPISPQLDGQAFTGDTILDGPNGNCDRWGDLLLAPRNWVMDIASESWWQIEDPASFEVRFWSSSKWRAQAYGAPKTFLAAGTAFALWEMDDLAYSWTWKSQPLWVTRDHYMTVRGGTIALQGHGFVTLEIINESGDSSSQVFQVDSDVVRNFRCNLSMIAENLTVKLTAWGGDEEGVGTSEAPLMHRLFLAYEESQHLRLTAS